MAIIEWDDNRFRLGVNAMDDTHIEFVELVNAVDRAEGEEFIRLFDLLISHTREHFDHENKLMIESEFPALAEHRGEHERVLGELVQFGQRVHKGLIPFGRSYLRSSIVHWFPLHAATMDSALAAHLKSRAAIPDGIAITTVHKSHSG